MVLGVALFAIAGCTQTIDGSGGSARDDRQIAIDKVLRDREQAVEVAADSPALDDCVNALGLGVIGGAKCIEPINDLSSALGYLQKGIDATNFEYPELDDLWNSLGDQLFQWDVDYCDLTPVQAGASDPEAESCRAIADKVRSDTNDLLGVLNELRG